MCAVAMKECCDPVRARAGNNVGPNLGLFNWDSRAAEAMVSSWLVVKECVVCVSGDKNLLYFVCGK